jgi:hypothetical protein
MSDHGYTPLGKFSSARDSLLHFLCISNWNTGEFGNVSDYGIYVWRIDNGPQDVALVNGEFTHVIEDWFIENPEVTDSEELRSELVGHFIIVENDQGFVNVVNFENETDLNKIYGEMLDQYCAWDDCGPDYFED